MTINHSTRRVLRFGAVATIALMASACASQPSSTTPTTEQAGASQEPEATTYLRYCDSLAQEGDLYVAAGMCQRAFEVDRTNVAALHKLGAIMIELGKYENAVEAYATALSVDPDDNEARYGLAKTYMEVGQFDLAAIQLKNAIAKDGTDTRYYNAMGVIKDQQGDHQQAQVFYNQGLKIDPSNNALLNNMGLSRSLSEQGSDSLAMATPTAAPAEPVQVASAPATQEPDPAPQAQPASDAATTKSEAASKPAPVVVRPKVVIKDSTTATEETTGPNEIEAAAFVNESYENSDAANVIEDSGDEPLTFEEPAAAQSEPMTPKSSDSEQSISIAGSTSGSVESTPGTATEAAAAKLPSQYLGPKDTQVAAKPTDDKAMIDTASSKDKSYAVQVGSYSTPESAFRGWDIIAEGAGEVLQGLEPEVVEADAGSDKGIVYRLRTGAFADRAASDALCGEIEAKGFGCFTVKLPRDDDGRVVAKAEVSG